MTSKAFGAVLCAAVFAWAGTSGAQVNQQRIKMIQSQLQNAKAHLAKLSPAQTRLVPGNARAAYLADAAQQVMAGLSIGTIAPGLSANKSMLIVADPIASGIVAVSDPSTDFAFSAFTGFTQSTSSIARCDSSVVVGFNDSGSFFETAISGVGGIGLSGVAFSTDGGASFTDIGPIPPGSNPLNLLLGEPVVACSDARTFYYLQTSLTSGANTSLSAMALSTSTDGGATWSDPIAPIAKDGSTHTLDKGWMAVDPSNPKRIYVSYTDLDTSFSTTACPNDFRSGIEIVASNDGGQTFGAPIIVDQVCGVGNSLENSHLAVGSNGTVYVAWEEFLNFPTGARQLSFTTLSPNLKQGPIVVVDGVIAGGDTLLLEGGFPNIHGIDLAVDRSGGRFDGALYIAWDDGRNKSVPDAFSQTGTYSFDDVLVRQSFDGGKTWGVAPVQVNSDSNANIAFGHDHYQPAIAVDSTGTVAVCWYDRRSDPENLGIERWCATSTDHGSTWQNIEINAGRFGPVHDTDGLINPAYMGDYDGLASNFAHHTAGFIGSFQVMDHRGNPDVKAVRFP